MTLDALRETARALPLSPGVYIMQDASNEVIYVGKAKALKNRVSQYFQNMASHNEKTRLMVSQVDHFDVILAQSEFEALVLECSLIKRHQPRYNILLKDSKGYPYIRLSSEEYPQFSVVSKPSDDGAKYFGPLASRHNTFAIIDALRVALKLPSCNRKFPRDIGKDRPCLNFQIEKCDGYCRSYNLKAQHDDAIAQAVDLLNGKYKSVQAQLAAQMEDAAQAMRFEQAAILRDRMRAIEQLGTKQKVITAAHADTDVVGIHLGETKGAFVVLHYNAGTLAEKDFELIEQSIEDTESQTLSALLRAYYHDSNVFPQQILLPVEIDDGPALSQLFSQQAGHKVSLSVPQRGEKTHLVALAQHNAQEEVLRATTKQERQNKLMQLLMNTLSLEQLPHRIESYDISNTGASNIVASMVVFHDGRPLKRDYRHFKLNDMQMQNDYAAMEQVLTRRLQRFVDGDEKFSPLPDLFLIDGGAEHLAVALHVLSAFNLSIPAFGMVKDDRHRTRALISPQGEIGIVQTQAIFTLIGQIQEETHRFAIEYHRKLQNKGMRQSALDAISGVGQARKKALLRHFKSIQNIRSATVDELCAAVPKSAAAAVYAHFHTAQPAPDARKDQTP